MKYFCQPNNTVRYRAKVSAATKFNFQFLPISDNDTTFVLKKHSKNEKAVRFCPTAIAIEVIYTEGN